MITTDVIVPPIQLSLLHFPTLGGLVAPWIGACTADGRYLFGSSRSRSNWRRPDELVVRSVRMGSASAEPSMSTDAPSVCMDRVLGAHKITLTGCLGFRPR